MNSRTEIAATFLDEALEFLRELVGINSFTANPPGIRAVGERIATKFGVMGFQAAFHEPSNPAHGPHLFLHRPGNGAGPSIALVSHLDTVFPPEEEEKFDFRYRRAGRRIYGPGSNDIKGGTALIWMTLMTLRETAPALYESVDWHILHNACEEVISTDFERLCRELLPADLLACLIFEGDGGAGESDEFKVVRSRKGRGVFRVEVEGRAAHAGSQHAAGVNAIVHLSRVVEGIAAITDYAEAVTVNVGTIGGGTVVNRVPHEAHAELEMRAFTPEAFNRAKDRILAHASEGLPRVTVRLLDETRPWPRNSGTDRLVEIWQEAAREDGIELLPQDRGGLSDGNGVWDLFPTLDGLGPRGENAHCAETSADGTKDAEWVEATSFVPKTAMNVRALELLVARGR